jgi:hypothetical protein
LQPWAVSCFAVRPNGTTFPRLRRAPWRWPAATPSDQATAEQSQSKRMLKQVQTGRGVVAIAILAAALPCGAATILGTVWGEGNQPAANLPLSLACPGAPGGAGQTDARGAYRLSVSGSGKCTLSTGAARAEVVLFNQAPTQYDFSLQGSGDSARLSRR